ncbi:nucleotidyltransferase domain-containing protein [Anaerosporobacter sp.]|uniref:nucleotidyltransferase domain-containing protein n=1 Tax=Anaerosporobacter sp. TaxID=1872529 RepID=UPI00286F8193|nr:nucleotidyltransferase domain-containing protein [Anaerosporobacter sp.]
MDNVQNMLMKFSKKMKDILGANLSKVILYGSYARGEQQEHSDIDIMILTSLTDVEIERIEPIIYDVAFDFEMEYFIDISVIVKNEEHFEYWLGALPFYDNIEREGVVLNG